MGVAALGSNTSSSLGSVSVLSTDGSSVVVSSLPACLLPVVPVSLGSPLASLGAVKSAVDVSLGSPLASLGLVKSAVDVSLGSPLASVGGKVSTSICAGVSANVAPFSVTCTFPLGSVCITSASLVSPFLFLYVILSPAFTLGATNVCGETSKSVLISLGSLIVSGTRVAS